MPLHRRGQVRGVRRARRAAIAFLSEPSARLVVRPAAGEPAWAIFPTLIVNKKRLPTSMNDVAPAFGPATAGNRYDRPDRAGRILRIPIIHALVGHHFDDPHGFQSINFRGAS